MHKGQTSAVPPVSGGDIYWVERSKTMRVEAQAVGMSKQSGVRDYVYGPKREAGTYVVSARLFYGTGNFM